MANVTPPNWLKLLQERYLSRMYHTFLAHLNVNDYVAVPGLTVQGYLIQVLPRLVDEKAKQTVVGQDGAGKPVRLIDHRQKGSDGKVQPPLVVVYTRTGFTFPNDDGRPDTPDRRRFCEITGLLTGGTATGNAVARQVMQQMNNTALPEIPSAPDKAVRLLEKALGQYKTAVVLIIRNMEFLWPDNSLAHMGDAALDSLAIASDWSRVDVERNGHLIVGLTPNLAEIHEKFRKARWDAIAIGLPSETERLAFIREIAAQRKNLRWDVTPEELARTASAINLFGLEDVLLHAQQNGGVVSHRLVKERKDAILKAEYGGLLESMETGYGFSEVGGCQHRKPRYQRFVIDPLKGKSPHAHLVPKGILMPGAPGLGKSFFVGALATEAGVQVVKLVVGRILNKFVGESEANIERVLEAIRAMAPIIVFIDEIDQAFSRSSGESSVNSRIFGRILDFMADPSLQSRVVFVAATNRPDLIDPALMRPGRLDLIDPFVPPDAEERGDVIRIILNKMGISVSATTLEEVAQATEGWTQAELTLLARKASELTLLENKTSDAALRDALHRIFPNTREISGYTNLALQVVNDPDWLTPRYAEMWRNARLAQQQTDEPFTFNPGR